MYQEAFQKLELAETATILDRFNPLFEGSDFDPIETTIMAQNISFYPGYRYLDIADYSSANPVRRYAIEGGKEDIVLDWTNAPIYKLNKEAPITLNENTAADYLRFFLNHVRGKHGRFLIAENIDDIRWRDDPPPAARKSIGKMLIALAIKEQKADGTYILPMTVMFKDSLFQCEARILKDGTVKIENEEILVEDIPVLDDSFDQ